MNKAYKLYDHRISQKQRGLNPRPSLREQPSSPLYHHDDEANYSLRGGSIAQRLAHLLPVPAAPGSSHGSGKFFREKNISDVAMLIDSKDSEIKSFIVDRTHPVLVRVVLQKKKNYALVVKIVDTNDKLICKAIFSKEG
jgi:hypothetical protein